MIAITWRMLMLLGVFGVACSTVTVQPSGGSAEVRSVSGTLPLELILARGMRVTFVAEPLSIELVDVRDSRCPIEFQCIWAGHAAVTLLVSAGTAPAQTIVIGTPAPATLNLAADAQLGGYHFRLQGLTPPPSRNAPAAPEQYRATVKISRLQISESK